MLTFKSLAINSVDLSRNLLTLMLTFKLLIINVVDLVDLYMRICVLPKAFARTSPPPLQFSATTLSFH